jgi:hypothetical protein
MTMCVMAVVGVAPCQCFSPGGHQITSPGRIFSTGPPQLCTRPQPAVTIRVWPSGWVCYAVRAPGSNVTLTPSARAGSGAWNRGSMRTVPVKYASGHLPEGCEPLLLMSIVSMPPLYLTVIVVLSCVATHTAMWGQGVLSGRCGVTKDMHGRRVFSMVNDVRLSPSSNASLKNNVHPGAGPS